MQAVAALNKDSCARWIRASAGKRTVRSPNLRVPPQLVAWWGDVTPGANAANLGARLQESLASEVEHKLFATYFKSYRSVLGAALPALLPQVYLHYDPAIVKTLRHRLPLPRQRMDFLLLLPGRQRVVIEVESILRRAILGGSFTYTARPDPVPGDLRMSWGIAVLILALFYSRGKIQLPKA
ncbi:hypothetical protein [Phyllobacterium salinisoli]|uniref:hypothetical protein n=1 Tax=Phyllobacterium salinisoli TaxID=1899321 RepID=UPI001FE0FF66|nr:hypothetical protein [Phyllobacterium salinisoli]